ncbi:phosphonate C-P lyase system protein PhnH [Dyella jejuensis]
MLAAFADPVFDSQRVFRQLLQAMARPALPRALPVLPPAPAPVTSAAMAIVLTLCDATTCIWLQQPSDEVARHLRFHAGVKLVDNPQDADFALITDPMAMPPLAAFARGELRYPDRSASLIVQLPGFRGDAGLRFAGPGIPDIRTLAPTGLSANFWTQRAALSAQLPLGIDLYFVTAEHVAALPRTTRWLED